MPCGVPQSAGRLLLLIVSVVDVVWLVRYHPNLQLVQSPLLLAGPLPTTVLCRLALAATSHFEVSSNHHFATCNIVAMCANADLVL